MFLPFQFLAKFASMRYLNIFSRTAFLSLLVLSLSSCEMKIGDERESYAKKLDQAFEAWAKHDNELLNFYQPGFADKYGQSQKELSEISREAIAASAAGAREGLEIIQNIDTAGLEVDEKLDVATSRHFFEILVEGEKYAYYECPINPVDGLHFALFEDLAFGYQMNAKNDGDFYLARARNFPRKVDQLKTFLNECAKQGTLPPRSLMEAVARQAQNLAEIDSKEHPIYRGIARQLGNADPVMINELEATDYLIASSSNIEEYVAPAYAELVEMIEVLKKNAGEEISVQRFVDGDAFYKYQLKKYLGREVKVEGLHQWGLRQMDSLLELHSLEDLKHTDTLMPAARRIRTQVASLDSIRAYLQRMKRNSAGLMGEVPATKIYVLEMPDWAMEYTPTWKYYPPSLSGHRRGILLVDMTHPDYQGVLAHRVQFYQNGIPGLHLIKSANLNRDEFSELLKYLRFEGNLEGWKLYSGDLVVNTLGLLQAEKTAYAEYIQEKLRGIAKLIVDTGIHTEGWSRIEAMEFLQEKISLSQRESKILIDECIIYPGKNCVPWLGYMDLLDLQAAVQNVLGEAYLLQDFHDLIMRFPHSPFNLTRSRLPLLLN